MTTGDGRTSDQGDAPAGQRRTAVGTVRTMVGVAYFTLMGLVLGIYVPRALHPESYALFAVAFSFISWVETTAISLLVGGIAKLLIDEGANWRRLAGSALVVGCGIAVSLSVVVYLAAPLVARALGDPALVPYLRLLVLDPPLFIAFTYYATFAHAQVQYERRVLIIGAYWTVRALATIGLVSAGYGVSGAIGAAICGSGAAVLAGIALTNLGAPRYAASLKPLFTFNWPLAVATMAITLARTVDLWMVKALLPAASAAGIYAIAAMIGSRLSPLLSSVNAAMGPKLVQSVRDGNAQEARALLAQSYRFGLVVTLGVVAVFTPQAAGLLRLLFSEAYVAAADPARILIWTVPLALVTETAGWAFVAAHRPWLLVACTVPTLAVAVALDWALIPRYGLPGAAVATTAAFVVYAAISLGLCWATFQRVFPLLPLLRCLLAGAVVWGIGSVWRTSGPLLLAECAALLVAYLLLLAALGELTRRDIQPVFAAFRLRRSRPA